jgi:hypothetical protein
MTSSWHTSPSTLNVCLLFTSPSPTGFLPTGPAISSPSSMHSSITSPTRKKSTPSLLFLNASGLAPKRKRLTTSCLKPTNSIRPPLASKLSSAASESASQPSRLPPRLCHNPAHHANTSAPLLLTTIRSRGTDSNRQHLPSKTFLLGRCCLALLSSRTILLGFSKKRGVQRAPSRIPSFVSLSHYYRLSTLSRRASHLSDERKRYVMTSEKIQQERK